MSMFLLAASASSSKTVYLLLDVLVCLWILGGVIAGGKKGFVECFFKLISTVLALVIAIMLASWLLDLTDGLFGLEGKLGGVFSGSFDSVDGFDEYVYTETRLQSALDELHLPNALNKLVIKYFNESYSTQDLMLDTPTAAEVFSGALGYLLALVIAGLIIFIIAKILLRLIRKGLTALVEKISAIRVLNSVLGTVMGAAQTLINIWITIALAQMIYTGSSAFMAHCTVLGFLADHNLLMNLITALL